MRQSLLLQVAAVFRALAIPVSSAILTQAVAVPSANPKLTSLYEKQEEPAP
jgi:hypothetical protein